MNYPQEVTDAVMKAMEANSSDIAKATEVAEKAIRKLDVFPSLVDQLVHAAIQDLVYDARHKVNVAMRRQSGYYGNGTKLQNERFNAVDQVYREYYTYNIAGTELGKLLGKELLKIAKSERAIAGGHVFNALLCEALAQEVADEKTVSQCVSERKLRLLFRKCQEKANAE